jgi:hypothetical protein
MAFEGIKTQNVLNRIKNYWILVPHVLANWTQMKAQGESNRKHLNSTGIHIGY